MTSIVELFPKCRKLAYDARQQVAQVQQQGNSTSISELYLVLEELNRQLDCMDDLVLRETPQQRDVWKRKIAELRNESASLQTKGQAADRARTTNTYQREREELLRRRRRRVGDEGDLQDLADESQSLEQSQFMVGSLISQGEASMGNLVDQRQRMRGTLHRVVVDMGSRLGLTQSTMRIIERRDITDAYLVLAGMIVTCLVIYFVWF
jgi:Golgi SNAP receptor complex protein 2